MKKMENCNFALNYLNLYCLILCNLLVPIMYLQNMHRHFSSLQRFDVDFFLSVCSKKLRTEEQFLQTDTNEIPRLMSTRSLDALMRNCSHR